MTTTPENYIADGDDFDAYYFSDHYVAGMDDERMTRVAVVISVLDLADATGDDTLTESLVEVRIIPTELHADALKTVRASMGDESGQWVKSDEPASIVEACKGYGYYADVTDYANAINLPDVNPANIEELTDASDNDAAREWVRANGQRIADACAGTIGFALDRAQNRIGETGWDHILRYVFEDYSSPTMWR